MPTNFDDVLQLANDEGTVEDSLIALFTNTKKQLDDVLSGVTIPPATQAKVDAIFSKLTENKDKVAAAVLANTPSEPTDTGNGGSGEGTGG